jgi:hypothetical protein
LHQSTLIRLLQLLLRADRSICCRNMCASGFLMINAKEISPYAWQT